MAVEKVASARLLSCSYTSEGVILHVLRTGATLKPGLGSKGI